MGFKITLDKKTKKLLSASDSQGLLPQVRKEFAKTGPIKVKQAIIQDVIKGISPVKGGGKYKKYSPSYKQAIKGEAQKDEDGRWFIIRNIGGRPKKIFVKKKKLDRNALQDTASPTKRITPVNLRLTGGLHRSLKVFTKGGFFTGFKLVTQFKHYLADIHNRRGAGKSKVKRRLLPTKAGEVFNRRINTVLIDQLKKAVAKVAKEFSRL